MPGWMDRWSRAIREWLWGDEPTPSIDEILSRGESVKLVIGLGNLDTRYKGTRHNIGFEVVEALAREHQATFSASKLQATTCAIHPVRGDRLVLARPTTLMNRSGFAVAQLLDYYKL